ncbi:MAG: putative metallo-hydrolase YycJ [Firmicutes bacterium ADurb.Bin182]|nr:MAG: putative metallo-hydrolase YycJ [Firmicutes bacterium ADurb.Bin182]
MKFSPLFSGSSGNCSFLEAENVRLLIDAGLAGCTVTNALAKIGVAPETLNAILITHEHSDHISGVGVLSRKYKLPVYANERTWNAMREKIGYIPPKLVRVFETDRDFYIKELNVLPFSTPHDAAEPIGYCFSYRNKKVSIMTDIGHVTNRMLDIIEHSSLLLLEANHDVEMLLAGSYPYHLKRRILSDTGHLSNENAGKALAKLYLRGLRNVILGHLSRENNLEPLALETVKMVLRQEDIPDTAVNMGLAHRDRPSGIYIID